MHLHCTQLVTPPNAGPKTQQACFASLCLSQSLSHTHTMILTQPLLQSQCNLFTSDCKLTFPSMLPASNVAISYLFTPPLVSWTVQAFKLSLSGYGCLYIQSGAPKEGSKINPYQCSASLLVTCLLLASRTHRCAQGFPLALEGLLLLGSTACACPS